MVKKRSQRIQLIIDIALNAEQQAARNLGVAQEELSSDQQRVNELNQYYQSYSEHFADRTSSLTASDLSRSREFLANLDKACKAQQAQISVAEKNVELALSQWRECHHKVQTLESFQERCATAERRHADKLEQKLLDELASMSRRNAI